MLGAGEGLDSESGEGSRLDVWEGVGGGAPLKVNWGCGLGLAVGAGVEEASSVSKEVKGDSVVTTGVEVGPGAKAG